MDADIAVSSPGRICLFGEHQDYLGLPVVAAAVNLRAHLRAKPAAGKCFTITMPDTGEREVVDFSSPIVYEKPRDYYRSGAKVLMDEGVVFEQGLDVELHSDIPIAKGCSSSSAILVAWIGLLHAAAGKPLGELSPERLAKLAYRAEVLEFKEPGGMMDHFASAVGGALHIVTRGEFRVFRIPAPRTGAFVLVDSLEPKDTTGVLGRVKKNVLAGFAYLKEKMADFDIEKADSGEVERTLGGDVSDEVRRAVIANLANRDITRIALKLFTGCGAEGHELGTLLDAHHANLRDGLGISTPKIERLINAAKSAGAIGCKINGSGGGGCMIAYTLEDPDEIAESVRRKGGEAYILKVDSGYKEEAAT